MKRLTPLAIALVLTACADNRSSVEIDGRAAPSDTTTCKFSADGERQMGPGLLDVAPSTFWPVPHYSMVVYVKNSLADPATLNPGAGTNPGSITSAKVWTANAARVRVNPRDYLSSFPPNPALLDFTADQRIPLDGQTVEPNGRSTQWVEAVSGPVAAQLATVVTDATPRQVVLGITLEGRTLDGARLDSGEWYFALDVCYGCLVPNVASVCAPGQLLRQSNCYGVGQDSFPVCATP